ncbi:MAG: PQQ-binding-like beta-propeller repeat protein [Acidobacteriota bacterium]|nr:PQQ-binding-like beta-propeller repeat protein [Acidobacteriota bacterium]
MLKWLRVSTIVACALAGTALVPVARARQAAAPIPGAKLYVQSCEFCHGQRGLRAQAPSLRDLGLSVKQLESVIAQGKVESGMPAFNTTYSPAQISDIVAYIISFSGNPVAEKGAEARAASMPGGEIYATYCATCHEAGGPPYLNHTILKEASPDYIVYMLSAGTMHVQGARLTSKQRIDVAEFITGKNLGASPSVAHPANLCSRPPSANFSGPQWQGWGAELTNARFQSVADAGLDADQLPHLKLKWAFALRGGFTSYAQPTVAGGRVFVGGPLGGVYSLDASTGCTYWEFQANAGVRTAITVASDDRAYFGDLRANVYAVSAATGRPIWQTRLNSHPYARITGSPVLYKGTLYVPVSSREEWMAADAHYPCCTFRGLIAALDSRTGKILWKTYTISEPARPTRKNKIGTQLFGPSGAGLWSTPTIDAERGVLYIGAGNNYSDPTTPLSDAILAVNLKTGKIVWSRQITSNDTYNVSCYRDAPVNCPAKQGPDSDFGSSPILRKLPDGKRVLIVAQKSGIVFGLDPDAQGKIVWQTRIGQGGPLGGVEWGPAADAGTVFAALSDLTFAPGAEGLKPDPKIGGGLFAMSISDGEVLWKTLPPSGGCSEPQCSPAQSSAVSGMPGVVFSGADDGHLRAYSTSDGKILWDFDAAREFTTVNGVPARGGAIDGGGPAIAGGMVFVDSGYGSIYGIPGNVLLAFGVEK